MGSWRWAVGDEPLWWEARDGHVREIGGSKVPNQMMNALLWQSSLDCSQDPALIRTVGPFPPFPG